MKPRSRQGLFDGVVKRKDQVHDHKRVRFRQRRKVNAHKMLKAPVLETTRQLIEDLPENKEKIKMDADTFTGELSPGPYLNPDLRVWWPDDALIKEHEDQLNAVMKERGHRFFQDCYRENWANFIRSVFLRYYLRSDVWFFTGTFPYTRPTDAGMVRYFTEYVNRLRLSLNQKGDCKDPMRWVLVKERQKRGRQHLHAIIAREGLSGIDMKRWEKKWEGFVGGTCCIHPAYLEAIPYILKDVRPESDPEALVFAKELKNHLDSRPRKNCSCPSEKREHHD